jgi:hypothetical protein
MMKVTAMLAELKLPANERTNLRHKIRRRMVPLAKLSVNKAIGTSMQTKSMLRTITAIKKSSDIEGCVRGISIAPVHDYSISSSRKRTRLWLNNI